MLPNLPILKMFQKQKAIGSKRRFPLKINKMLKLQMFLSLEMLKNRCTHHILTLQKNHVDKLKRKTKVPKGQGYYLKLCRSKLCMNKIVQLRKLPNYFFYSFLVTYNG